MLEPRIFNPGSGTFSCCTTQRMWAIGGATKDDGGESWKRGPHDLEHPANKHGQWQKIKSVAAEGVFVTRRYAHFEAQQRKEDYGLSNWASVYLRQKY